METFGRPSRSPSHIIVLRDGVDDWEALGSLVGGVESVVDLVWDRTVLVPLDHERPVATVFRRFGIVTADLTPAEVAHARLDPRVRAVASNERQVVPEEAGPVAAPVLVPTHSESLRLVGIPPGYNTRSGQGVRVAVLDSGIAAHDDFENRVVATRRFVAGGGPSDVTDDTGHGTGVAGVIAARKASHGNVTYGVAPRAELVVGKVIHNRACNRADVIAGINWATHPDQGALLVCLSLWFPRAVDESFHLCVEQVAGRLRAETPGAVLIAAAGNGSDRDHTPPLIAPVANPAACPNILAIAATKLDRAVLPSSCGECDAVDHLDYAAPGQLVYTAGLNNRFQSPEGTSFAAPHVVGIAALRLEELIANLGGGGTLRAVDVLPSLASRRDILVPATDFGAGIPLAP